MSVHEEMSLNENPSLGLSPGLSRSQSFLALLNISKSSMKISPSGTPILGNGGKTTEVLNASLRKKLPRIPRPQRTLLMFQSVLKGLSECIDIKMKEVEELRNGLNQGQMSLAQHLLRSEQSLNRLQEHYARVSELHSCYGTHNKMRDAVKSMAHAYVMSPGNQKNNIAIVKNGWKECTQTLCAIEAQFEQMMGSFYFKTHGLTGFARLCPGDHYEIVLRYGSQTWKNRVRIGKQGNQTWDTQSCLFKAVLGDVLQLKAREVKLLLKNVLLGEKNCDTCQLFAAHPQLMTVSLNRSGSLKLGLQIAWNPLDKVDSRYRYFNPSAQSSLRHKNNGSLPFRIPLDKDDDQSAGAGLALSHFECNTDSSGTDETSPSSVRPDHYPEPVNATMALATPTSTLSSDSTHSCSEQESTVTCSLHETIERLSLDLDDYRGQYAELQALEELVLTLENTLKHVSHQSSDDTWSETSGSELSIAIESALNCFDFLETETEAGEVNLTFKHATSSFHSEEGPSSSSTNGHSDSSHDGECNGSRRSRDDSGAVSPLIMSSGNDQVDSVTIIHLQICNQLIRDLGTFGPLRCREILALDKLHKQADVLRSILRLVKRRGSEKVVDTEIRAVLHHEDAFHFWSSCCGERLVLVVPLYRFRDKLKQMLERVLDRKELIPEVMKCLFRRSFIDNATKNVTVYQLVAALGLDPLDINDSEDGREEQRSLTTIVQTVIDEVVTCAILRTLHSEEIARALLKYRHAPPPEECLKQLAAVLLEDDDRCRNASLNYLDAMRTGHRKSLVVTYVQALEDPRPQVRAGACAAMAALKAEECIEQLVYLSHCDVSPKVREIAKRTLFSFGDDGRVAYEECSRTSNGFQGLRVNTAASRMQ